MPLCFVDLPRFILVHTGCFGGCKRFVVWADACLRLASLSLSMEISVRAVGHDGDKINLPLSTKKIALPRNAFLKRAIDLHGVLEKWGIHMYDGQKAAIFFPFLALPHSQVAYGKINLTRKLLYGLLMQNRTLPIFQPGTTNFVAQL